MRIIYLFLLFLTVIAIAADEGLDSFDSLSDETASSRPRNPINAGLDIQYVPVQYSRYSWTDGQTTSTYGNGVYLGVEWVPFDERFGKLGIGLGAGLYAIRNVTFDDTHASLTTIPLQGYLSYHFDYVENQILVPFVRVGTSLTLARQQGIEVPGWQTHYGLDYGAGLQLCLNHIDRSASKELSRRIGIYNTYLVTEYLRSGYLGQRRAPDLTHDEFRVGLRFEM